MQPSQVFQEILLPAIAEANRMIPNFRVPAPSESTALFGVENAALDSFALVSFVFLLEKEVERRTGTELRITSEDVLNSSHNPFGSLGALADFLGKKIPAYAR